MTSQHIPHFPSHSSSISVYLFAEILYTLLMYVRRASKGFSLARLRAHSLRYVLRLNFISFLSDTPRSDGMPSPCSCLVESAFPCKTFLASSTVPPTRALCAMPALS
jgi:hypothetical protein